MAIGDYGPEVVNSAVNLAWSFYVGESCTICGGPIEWEDHNARWTGYDKGNTGRLAHDECWRSCFGVVI